MITFRPANGIRYAAAVAAMVVVASLVPPGARADGGITVSGTGTLEVSPDMAYLALGIRAEGDDPTAIAESVNAGTGRVMTLLDELGVDAQDVTARQLILNPRMIYEHGRPEQAGFTATRPIQVVVRDLDRMGVLVQRALAAGVNQTSTASFDHSNRDALERQALELAMRDAREQAEHIAKGFGVRLGTLVSAITDNRGPSPRPMMALAESRASAEPTFAAGTINIVRNVTATFAIAP